MVTAPSILLLLLLLGWTADAAPQTPRPLLNDTEPTTLSDQQMKSEHKSMDDDDDATVDSTPTTESETVAITDTDTTTTRVTSPESSTNGSTTLESRTGDLLDEDSQKTKYVPPLDPTMRMPTNSVELENATEETEPERMMISTSLPTTRSDAPSPEDREEADGEQSTTMESMDAETMAEGLQEESTTTEAADDDRNRTTLIFKSGEIATMEITEEDRVTLVTDKTLIPEIVTTVTDAAVDPLSTLKTEQPSSANADNETKDNDVSLPLVKSSETIEIHTETTTTTDIQNPDVATTTEAEKQTQTVQGDKLYNSELNKTEDLVDQESTTHEDRTEKVKPVAELTTEQVAKSTETETASSTPKEDVMTEMPKNISLDDELEFRAAKLPLNVTKMHLNTTSDSNKRVTHKETTTEKEATESTTTRLITTLREIILSTVSTTTDPLTSTIAEETTVPEITSPETNAPETSSPEISTPETSSPETSAPESSSTEEIDDEPTAMDAVEEPQKEPMVEHLEDDDPQVELESVKKTGIAEEAASNVDISATEVPTTTAEVPTTEDITIPESTHKEATTTDQEPSKDLSTTTESATTFKTTQPQTTEPQTVPESESETEQPLNAEATSTKDRYVSGNNTDTVAAVQFLHHHDKTSSEQCFKLVDAHWNYATNLTEENKKKQLEQTLEYSLFHKEAWKNATSFAWKTFNDTLLRRWFKSLSVLGTAALPEDKLNEFNRLKAEMKNTYSTAKSCPYVSPTDARKPKQRACTLSLEPDLQRILTKSRDYDELAHVWKQWRDAAGKPIREKYLRFVELSNEAARLNGFPDTGDMWREAYESDSFEDDLEMLWQQLKPLYEHLHAYVRRRLVQQYGEDRIKEDGPIPAHLVGNMWAQSWVSLLDISQPYPGKPSVDVTPIMEGKNMSALEMFKISEEFFISLGLKPMPKEFWDYSLIEKPKDREIICHASAWDFCNGKDYRIKQCTDITMEDLITVHHEMGHIQYFLQYSRQPNVFREGANPGFHEAIGDVLALSVSTPKHLQSIGLLEEVADDPEGDLNFLLRTALDKVSFLPSGYLIDLWRWGLFSGQIKPEEMNSKWWELRLKYQGICPPMKRTDDDFDPGAKYHVPGNVPYIRYFVSFVIQFQFHKVLCDAAGHTGPLYKCDIYRSKEAGQILSQVMELGSSEHWSEAMKIMTGGTTNKMDAGPILEYFAPLLQFLQEQNVNETLGWKSEDPTVCP